MMRRVCPGILAVLALLLTVPALAATDEAVEVLVVSDTGDKIVLQFRLEDHVITPVSIGGATFHEILVPGEPVFKVKGAPALPHVNRSIIVPDDARMTVRVLSYSYREELVAVAPSKGILYRSVDPDTVPYEFGDPYGVDAFYPGPLAELGEPYILRDHRGVTVQINPFQYNPASGVLRIITEATVEVASAGAGQKNVLKRRGQPRMRVEAFSELYDAHFINPGQDDDELFYDPMDEVGDMLIICHDAWIDNMTPFVNHKATKGITATVVGVSTIGNDAASIKSYIQDVYDTSDLAFVLLVGDAAQVATPQASGGAADPTYSKLAGADNYPDIIVGRFSAGTAAEVDTQVERTITYETLPAQNQDWFWKGTGIASAEGAGIGDEGQSDIQHQNEIRGWLLGAGYTEVDQIYDPGATDTQVANAVNAGRGVMNYTGHGSSTSWGTTGFNVADVDALTNDNMLPFIFSVACVNGNFDAYGKCFAEAWLRATNGGSGEPTGAVGTYMSSINQSWAPPMEGQDEMNLLLTDPTKPYSYYGSICYAGSCSMMDAYGSGGVDMFNTWHIFGDPSLHVVGDPPQNHGMKVTPADGLTGSGPAGGPVSPDSITYSVQNLEDVPMDYEVVCTEHWLSASNSTGTLDPGATAQVTVYFNDSASNCDNGAYSDNVQFINHLNHDGDTARSASLSIGAMTMLNEWTFSADPGWSVQGQWEFGVPLGSGGEKSTNPDPTSGATGSNVYGANLGGNISKAVGGPYYLTLGPLDFTGIQGTSISFQRWLNTVGPPSVASTFEVSGNGLTWSGAWESAALTADAAWTPMSFDISTDTDDRSEVYIRWGYEVAQKLPKASSGWNIDDVTIEGRPASVRIHLTVEPGSLSWTSAPGALSYDVVRGDLTILQQTGGDFTAAVTACEGNDLAGTMLSFAASPAAGEGYWFLVRGTDSNGPMTWQTLAGNQAGLRDEEINTSGASCP